MKQPNLLSPHTIIFLVLIVAAAGTWLLPAGKYNTLKYVDDHFIVTGPDKTEQLEASQETLDRLGIQIELEKFVNGDIFKPISIPGTYKELERNPQGLTSIILAPIKGMIETADIIFLVLMIGGLIEVYNKSGVLEKSIGVLTKKLNGKEPVLIVLLMILMAAGGTSFGMSEETIAFFPILVPAFLMAGYDLLIPLAVIFIGAHIGSMASTTNPFATIIASDTAGVAWTTGMTIRLMALAGGLIVSCIYIIRYGSMVKKNPAQSLVLRLQGKVESTFQMEHKKEVKLDFRNSLLLAVFISTFTIMVIGVTKLGWWMEEMSAIFLASAIISAFLMRMKEAEFVKTFIAGASGLIGVSLVIGIARGVTIVMNDGLIIDSILFYASGWIEGMPQSVFIIALMLVFFVLTFFISSTSGLAVVSMPIMAGLGVMANVPPETIVTSYIFGSGLMFLISPTGMLLPSLAMVNVTYKTWIKFVWPLIAILMVMDGILLFVDLYLI